MLSHILDHLFWETLPCKLFQVFSIYIKGIPYMKRSDKKWYVTHPTTEARKPATYPPPHASEYRKPTSYKVLVCSHQTLHDNSQPQRFPDPSLQQRWKDTLHTPPHPDQK